MALFGVSEQERFACLFPPAEKNDPAGTTHLFYRRCRPDRLREIRREAIRSLEKEKLPIEPLLVGERVNRALASEFVVGCRNYHRLTDPQTQTWTPTDSWVPEYVAELPPTALVKLAGKIVDDTVTEEERTAFLRESVAAA